LTRSIIKLTTGIFFRINKNRRICPSKRDLVKINLGSGLRVRQGWINIDASFNALISSCPKFILKISHRASGAKQNFSFEQYYDILRNNRFICHNLIFGIPFIDSCVDHIFCSHLLEHLTQQQGINLIKEMFRVLKEKGMVRIVVPDLAHAIDLYCSGEKEAALKRFFNDEENQNDFTQHKYMYDYEILSKLLANAGFTDITRCEYQHGKTPDINFLDKRPKGSLYVEAVRK
jgi:predicted SAM-dependent methyltransferase